MREAHAPPETTNSKHCLIFRVVGVDDGVIRIMFHLAMKNKTQVKRYKCINSVWGAGRNYLLMFRRCVGRRGRDTVMQKERRQK